MTDTIVDINKFKYDQAEKELRLKLVEFSEKTEIQAQLGEAFYIWKNDPEFISDDLTEEDVDDVTFEKFFDWFLYDFRLLDSGHRIIDLFISEERGNLSEAELLLAGEWSRNVYSFFEVEGTTPGESCRIRDIFRNIKYEVQDKATSRQIKRSDIIGARPLKTGDRYYFSGIISVYPSAFKPMIIDFYNVEYREYRKNQGKDASPERYLKDLGFMLSQYAEEIARNPRFLTPEGDEFVLASSVYEIRDMEITLGKIRKIRSLSEISGENEDVRLFTWDKKGKNRITASVEIENGTLRLECYSVNMLNAAKNILEAELKGALSHVKDESRSPGMFVQDKGIGNNTQNNLPAGVRSKKELKSVLDEHYDRWIYEPLALLGGLTPSEAATSNEGRENLKSVINDLEVIYEQARKRGEPYYDVRKLRRKLKID